MVAINFMYQFAPMIESGTKIHTLRDTDRCKVGDTLQLYTGQRTKKCRLIKEVVCTAVVQASFRYLDQMGMAIIHWKINGQYLSGSSSHAFAQNDGFPVFYDLTDWFLSNKGPQWSGYLIAWGRAPYLEDV